MDRKLLTKRGAKILSCFNSITVLHTAPTTAHLGGNLDRKRDLQSMKHSLIAAILTSLVLTAPIQAAPNVMKFERENRTEIYTANNESGLLEIEWGFTLRRH